MLETPRNKKYVITYINIDIDKEINEKRRDKREMFN